MLIGPNAPLVMERGTKLHTKCLKFWSCYSIQSKYMFTQFIFTILGITCRTGVIFLRNLGGQRRKRGKREERVVSGGRTQKLRFRARLAFTSIRLKYAKKIRLFCRLSTEAIVKKTTSRTTIRKKQPWVNLLASLMWNSRRVLYKGLIIPKLKNARQPN